MAATAKQKAEREKCRITTPEFCVSYPHLFKPQAMKGGVPKYSVTMLFKKTTDLGPIKLAMKQAKIVEFGPDKDKWPKGLESPVTDGDDPQYADREGYKGCWAIKATTGQEFKPGVYIVGPEDEDGNSTLVEVTDPAVIYPGCYADAVIFARVWEFGNKQGVQFILDHIRKRKDGTAFGGKKPAAQSFAPLEAESADDEEDDENADF